MRRSKGQRGQAMAEFAVCAIAFVALLTFGIHFGELGYLTAKVHEAGQHATWDATAYRAFNYGTGIYDSTSVAARVESHTNGLYANYVGLTSETGWGQPVLVDTQSSAPLNVNCGRDPSMAYSGMLPSVGEANGIWCSAQGQISPLGFAAGSLQLGGGAPLLPTTYNICGVGKASSGSCAPNHSSILLADLGLAANPGIIPSENQECELRNNSPNFSCSNPDFYTLVNNAWQTPPSRGWTGIPEAWGNGIDVPGWFGPTVWGGRITGFYMSFRGENSNFNEGLVPGGALWQTSPMDVPPPGTPTPVYREAYSTQPGTIAMPPATPAWPTPPANRKGCEGIGGAQGYCFLGKFPCN